LGGSPRILFLKKDQFSPRNRCLSFFFRQFMKMAVKLEVLVTKNHVARRLLPLATTKPSGHRA
jgi:hypothetical protein